LRLKAAICDDEKTIRDELSMTLKKIKKDISIEEFPSGEELLGSIEHYDVIFLDVEMQGIDGMETAKRIRRKDVKSYVVFLTGHMEFIQDAFKVRAFRYLNKPINIKDLSETISDIEDEIQDNAQFIFKSNGGLVSLKYEDVVCVEAFGDGIYVYTKDKVYTSPMSLKKCIAELGEKQFIQVHKSYVVAYRHIKAVNKTFVDMNYVKETVPVSRRKYQILKNNYYEYVHENAKYV